MVWRLRERYRETGATPLRRDSACPPATSNYAVVKDPRRGKRPVETSRGRKKSAQEYIEPVRECHRKRHISG